MIYLDGSALLTLVVEWRHARELRAYFDAHATAGTCTSTVGFVETARVCESLGDFPVLIAQLVDDHDEIPVTEQVRTAAVVLPGRLRTLDAIHLASAELIGPGLTAVVTYDERMAEVARQRGLPVAMPGME